jgi:hypothetical protein
MHVTSRAYKVIMDRSLFVDLDAALADIRDDIRDVTRSLGLTCEGEFGPTERKDCLIRFLDTSDFTLRQNVRTQSGMVSSKLSSWCRFWSLSWHVSKKANAVSSKWAWNCQMKLVGLANLLVD